MKTHRWLIRYHTEDDLSFIYSTWTHSYRYGSALGKSCRNSVFFKEYHQVINWILSDQTTYVFVAALTETPEVILGYIACDPQVIHYLFTKEAFRNLGVAKSLIEAAGSPMIYTHKTFCLNDILTHHGDEFIYNPFILFKKVSDHGDKYKTAES